MNIMNYFRYFIVVSSISAVFAKLRIYGGDEVPKGELMYVVFLKLPDATCTGAIIHPYWVLSAAHCVTNEETLNLVNPSRVLIIAGSINVDKIEDTGQVRKGKEILVHEYFDFRLGKPDLALVKVNESFVLNDNVNVKEFSTSVWPQNDGHIWNDCIAAGWGDTENGTTPTLKKLITSARHGRDTCPCIDSMDKLKRLVCLPCLNKVGTCFGDSGGALVCGDKIVGVAHIIVDKRSCSYTEAPVTPLQCGSRHVYGIYIYTCPFLDWISEYVPGIPNTPESCTGSLVTSLVEINIMYAITIFFVHNELTSI